MEAEADRIYSCYMSPETAVKNVEHMTHLEREDVYVNREPLWQNARQELVKRGQWHMLTWIFSVSDPPIALGCIIQFTACLSALRDVAVGAAREA